jgi:SCY1-like protein 1
MWIFTSARSNLEKSVESFPAEFNKNKVLPELLKALEFGAGGSRVIGSIAKISAQLTDDEYEKNVTPTMIKMFAIQDRQIRLNLLSYLQYFIDKINDKTIASSIYPQVVTGFNDSTPVIREATVKSMTLFAPKLPPKTLSTDTLKYLAKTVLDPEPGIRANTIICLGIVSKHFDDTVLMSW